jgi:hypothetical protein
MPGARWWSDERGVILPGHGDVVAREHDRRDARDGGEW